jgi:flagellar assembly protein FliH
MSLRTRRLAADAVAVERFAWSPTETGGHIQSLNSAEIWAPYDALALAATGSKATGTPASAASIPPEPFQPTADQQAQLAALERDAFTKGYAQGERAGLEAGGKRAEAMLRRLAQTLEELSGLRDNMVRQTERELVQLAVAIARRVLQREITVDPELTAALAHIALERLGGASPATVRLHPDDYAIVMSGQVAPLNGRQVEIRADPAVARGGCLVESEFGFINASVDAQVDEIARAVLGEPVPVAVARRGVA